MNINTREIKRIFKKAKSILFNDGPKVLFVRIYNELKARFIKIKAKKGELKIDDLLNNRFFNSQPIKYIKVKKTDYRLNIVTDSIKKDNVLGGVATALILAVLYCNKNNISLRIITRTAEETPLDFEFFLKIMKLNKPKNVEYYTDYDRAIIKNHHKLEVSEKDIFLATSWWSAHATQSINLRKNFFYILQEVETFFYPNGDDQLLCEEVLNNPDIKFIINSKLLYDYYKTNGYENVIKNGIYFEPAFIKSLYSANVNTFIKKEKYKLFFYSRPNHPRNLFFRGLSIIDEALVRGIIGPNWEIIFAGSDDMFNIVFSNGRRPKILGKLDWREYASFLSEIDLGLCLMFTPHPSYPPLDIASSGGVVLSNNYKNKKSLEYSKNIICRNLNKESFLSGLEDAVRLAMDTETRKMNYENNAIETDWNKSFFDVLKFMDNNK